MSDVYVNETESSYEGGGTLLQLRTSLGLTEGSTSFRRKHYAKIEARSLPMLEPRLGEGCGGLDGTLRRRAFDRTKRECLLLKIVHELRVRHERLDLLWQY